MLTRQKAISTLLRSHHHHIIKSRLFARSESSCLINNTNYKNKFRSFHTSSLESDFLDFFKSPPPVKNDSNSELQLLQTMAEQGDSNAQNDLGATYQNGTYGIIDYKKAVYWYEKSAAQNNAEGQYNLGYMYQEGLDVPRNIETAMKYYEKSANQHHAKAQNNLAIQFLAKGDKQKAIYWFIRSAENGNPKAQYNVGGFYAQGNGVEKNASTSFQWYLKSANGGYVYSQHNVGVMYINGVGVQQDYTSGIEWLKIAANQGFEASIQALNQLSTKDYATDVNWLNQLANKGDHSAQNNLGVMYQMGVGVEKDLNKAVYWLQKAADQGNDNALLNLGSIFLQERGEIPQDVEKAKLLFGKIKNQETKKAAEALLSLSNKNTNE